MTTSKHVYSVVAIGTPDKTLNVRGGTITLDAGSAPHVRGNLDVTCSAATLTSLDPRGSVRVRVIADGTFPSFSQHREFNLALRDRSVPQADGTVQLTLASDEALLVDYAALTDDTAPLGFQTSMRAMVNYILNKAIPGASLNTSFSAPDVAVLALADSENLVRNPRVGANTVDWNTTWTSGGATATRIATGGPSYSPTYYGVQAGAGGAAGSYIYVDQSAISVSQGTLYELSVDVRAHGGRQMSLDAILYDQSGNIVGFATPAVATPASAWVRLSVSFYASSNAAKVRPRVTPVGGLAGSEYADVTAWRLTASTGDRASDILYFDGATTDTVQYDYGWRDAAHASISTRQPLIDAATPDALTLKAGQTALDFLAPIVQRAGLRLVCNEARVWTLRAEDYSAPGLISIRHGVNLIDGTDTISRDSGLWFDGAVTIYTWTASDGTQQRRVDSYALTGTPTRVVTFEKSTPYPGPGFSEYAVRRAQGRGREVTATTVADWTAAAEQSAVIYLASAPTQVGASQTVVFDLTQDRMTTTTRTLEIGVGAIDLLTGTINGLTGTINGL